MERVGYGFAACIGNGERIAPCVVDVPCKQVALGVVNLIHVAGKGAANNVVRRNACRVFILNFPLRFMVTLEIIANSRTMVKTAILMIIIIFFLFEFKAFIDITPKSQTTQSNCINV